MMEESINEIETNQSFKSPPRRRRSTFFERIESIVPQTSKIENVDLNVCKQTSEEIDKNKEGLKRYHDKLLLEKEQWKKEVNNRRHKYHDLRQQYQMALKTPGISRMSYATLSNEDIEFLKGKPNISTLTNSHQTFHKSLKGYRAYHRRVNQLDDALLSNKKDKVNDLLEHVFEHSRIGP